MDASVVTAIVVSLVGALCGAGIAAALILRLRRDGRGPELAGRLDQMAASQAAANAELAKRLQEQERMLADAVAKRLSQLEGKVGEQLEKSAQQTTATVTDLRERLVKIDAAQKALGELSQQVTGLRDVLAGTQSRGAFGERVLEELVADALPGDFYAFQATLADGRRADCLLKLPRPPGPIVVDAKFPLESYRALQAAAAEQLVAARRAFVAAVTKQIDDIRDKYIVPGETADSALMFLPSEGVYAELHQNFREVIEAAYKKRVYLVSPSTLWAVLQTIRALLRDVRMREQAGVIQTEVAKLLEDVGRLDERAEKLQSHFGQVAEDVRNLRTSTDKIVKRGERIREVELEELEAQRLTSG